MRRKRRLTNSISAAQQSRQRAELLGTDETGAARIQARAASAHVGMDEAIRIAKERRFTLSAQLLTRQPIQVKVLNDPNYGVASFNVKTKVLTLNEGERRLDFSNPIMALVNHRASLYHEVDHALFTRDNGKRARLTEASKDKQSFSLLVNVLEDGRIEWLGKQKFPGSADFLNSSLMEMVNKLGEREIEGLHLYVRTGMFRNKAEASYWQPYKAKIDAAIRKTTTSKMLDVAFEICEAISERKPSEPQPQPSNEGEQSEGKGEQGEPCKNENPESAQSQPSDEGDEGEGESLNADEEESGDESGEGSESENETGLENAEDGEGEAEGEGESEDSEGGEESDSGESSNGAGGGDSEPEQIDNDTLQKVQEIVTQAMENCEAQAQADHEAIMAEAEAYEPEQAYVDDNESGASDELASAFTSLRVESARTRYCSSRAGLLNQATLASALTSRKCFHKREEQADVPHVALLLDVSYSMVNRAQALTSAARVLNGALRKSKINVKVISFGGTTEDDHLNEYKTIPVEESLQVHGNTPTAFAMKAANDWLESQSATRGLIIVVTDGLPDNVTDAQAQLQRAEANNAYVAGVLVGLEPSTITIRPKALATLTAQFNDYAFCPNVAELPTVLAPILAQYIAGT